MSQPELLKKTVEVLERLDVPFMLTGSIVSSLQGEPRLSHDIDLVVADIDALAESFPAPEYDLNRKAIREAISNRSMFNLLQTYEGDKIDFWLLTSEDFDRARFGRRQPATVADIPVFISSPEDTILQKLSWAKVHGGSEKQMLDAIRVYEVQSGLLDLGYLEGWIQTLRLSESWQQLIEQAKPLP